jgi:hypothetical protein
MYQPTLGRFLSRDPLSPNGVDVLTDTGFYADRLAAMRADPWSYGGNSATMIRSAFLERDLHYSSYAYVGNNPLTRLDPSGMDWAVCIVSWARCLHKGTPRMRLICYWRCRCPCDPPLQLDPGKPNYQPGTEWDPLVYNQVQCDNSKAEDEQSCRGRISPVRKGDCTGRGGGKPSEPKKDC